MYSGEGKISSLGVGLERRVIGNFPRTLRQLKKSGRTPIKMSDDIVGLMQSIDWNNIPEPLWRLIETTWRGIGNAGLTLFLGVRGRGEAKKLDAIATVMEKHSSGPLSITYKDEAWTIQTQDSQQQVTIPGTTLEQRTADRVALENQREQLRIENIVAYAVENLISETQVPNEMPSDDFVARFFDYAKTISTEEMQRLWGKIYSGEIKQPGTFSLRTLDVLRNISQSESELFVQVAQYAFYTKSEVFVPAKIDLYSNKKHFYRQLVLLAEIGLLHPTASGIYLSKSPNTNVIFAFSNDVAVSVVKDPNVQFRIEPPLDVWTFTNAARQLARFFDWNNPPGYVETFSEEAKKLGCIPTLGTYTNPNAPEFHENPPPS
jgi:Protein of unknown function (DUF2806)